MPRAAHVAAVATFVVHKWSTELVDATTQSPSAPATAGPTSSPPEPVESDHRLAPRPRGLVQRQCRDDHRALGGIERTFAVETWL
jgi:hypothetical protein